MAAPPFFCPGLLCDGTMWSAQLAALARDRPLAAPAYPGARTITAMAEQVLAQAPPTFSLVGHSMGGRVALEVCRLAPERVERLALLCTGLAPLTGEETAKRLALLELARTEGLERMLAVWLPPLLHPARRSDERLLAPLRAMALAGGVERVEDQIAAMLSRPDPRALLARLRLPLLIGSGEADGLVTVEDNRRLAGRLGQAQHVVFPSGHMAPLEAPEAVAAALDAWLAQPG